MSGELRLSAFPINDRASAEAMARKVQENPQDNKYTFFVNGKSGASTQFTLVTDDTYVGGESLKLPRKLGDGNFGIVFDARSTSNSLSYALKILYDQDFTEFDIQRILAELKIGIDLPARLRTFVDEKRDSLDADFAAIAEMPGDFIVLPIAFKANFTKFASAKDFEKLDMKLSKYAYIMEKFDCSLKDLVEGSARVQPKAPSSESGARDTASGGTGDLTRTNGPGAGDRKTEGGYERLRAASVEERERSAIPVLEQVARGLQTLHAAGFRHRDLKPANVYYKRTADRVQFRLGDLGFLNPQEDPVRAGSVAVTQAIGIGTKHYRSIEQIDFCDTAECDVEVLNEAGEAVLTTRDPKFMDTNIAQGDLVYFAKSSSRRHLTITKMEKRPDRGEVYITVAMSQEPGDSQDGEREPIALVDDKNTQVSFLKNPSARTDLFGLASIFYDIVSVGESPERFYELLRRFDVDSVSIEESIVRLYDTWQAGIIDDADVSAIFSRLNGGEGRRGTVNIEVLRFLLKSMMSNARDSYYNLFDFEKADWGIATGSNRSTTKEERMEQQLAAVAGWAKVIKEVKQLEGVLGATRYSEVEYNVLTRTRGAPAAVSPSQMAGGKQVRFADLLESYRKGLGPSNETGEGEAERAWGSAAEAVVARWLLTTALVAEMDRGLNRHMTSGKGSGPHMYSLAQEHLAVNASSVLFRRSVLEDDDRGLVASMRYRDPLLTRIRPFSHRFEPIWWRFGARRVLLDVRSNSVPEGAEGSTEQGFEADVEYADFAFSRQEAEAGDFILPSAGGSAVVFRVNGAENGVLQLGLCLDERLTGSESTGAGSEEARGIKDGYLVRNPDRVDYYAGMLAIYMFHFLVSEGSKAGSRRRDFPASAYGRIQDFPLKFSATPSERNRGVPTGDWPGIRRYTLQLIMWLSLGGFYFDRTGNRWVGEEEKWRCVHREVVEWSEAVYKVADAKVAVAGLNLLKGIEERSLVETVAGGGVEGVSSEEWERVCKEYLGTAETEAIGSDGEEKKPPEPRGGGWKLSISDIFGRGGS